MDQEEQAGRAAGAELLARKLALMQRYLELARAQAGFVAAGRWAELVGVLAAREELVRQVDGLDGELDLLNGDGGTEAGAGEAAMAGLRQRIREVTTRALEEDRANLRELELAKGKAARDIEEARRRYRSHVAYRPGFVQTGGVFLDKKR